MQIILEHTVLYSLQYLVSKVTAPMDINLLFVKIRFYERWGSITVDIGPLINGVMHMMRLIWDLEHLESTLQYDGCLFSTASTCSARLMPIFFPQQVYTHSYQIFLVCGDILCSHHTLVNVCHKMCAENVGLENVRGCQLASLLGY